MTSTGANARPIRVVRAGTSITLNTILTTQIQLLTEEGFEVICVCDEDEWTPPIRAAGAETRALGMGRRPSPVDAARWGIQFYKLLRELSPDVVHTHNAFHGVAGRIAARAAGVPVVVQTIHNWWFLDPPTSPRAQVFRWLERFAAVLSQRTFFINSDDFARAGSQHLVASQKRMLIGNGIDTVDFQRRLSEVSRSDARASLELRPEHKVFAMIARMEPPKDHPTLLAAFDRVRQSHPYAKLLLAGQGMAADQVAQDVAHRGLSEHVIMLGHQQDIVPLLRASDFGVLSSVHEGFGRSLVEAMVAGLPVVGSDVVGIRDVIHAGATGLLAPAKDPSALADAMQVLIEDPQLAMRLGGAGHLHALAHFDERRPAQLIMATYRELLSSKHH